MPAATATRPKRFGSEVPRIFTPPLRELTPETTLGFAAIDFAEDILELTLLPWQKWLLIHMLELLPDGSLRFTRVVVLVARQNGKSTLSQVLSLFFMMVMGWPLVLGTAQDLDVAEEVWQGAVGLLEEDPELASLIQQVVKVNGKKALVLKAQPGRPASRYKVKAANRRAGRGLSGNLILLDELREHQNWLAWGAITKTANAQQHSLILALSNAGDITSVVLAHLRKQAHKALGDPDGICSAGDELAPTSVDLGLDEDEAAEVDHLEDFEQWEDELDSLGIFEWSAPPGCSIWDRDGWAWGNPSLGYLIQERTIASDARTDPEWVFRTEDLCQWADSVLDGPFPAGAWEQGTVKVLEGSDGSKYVPESQRIPPGDTVVACVDTSHDRSMTRIAFAGHTPDGTPKVEVVAERYGQDWVEAWLMDPKRHDRIRALTGQSRGAPVSQLLTRLKEDEVFDIPVVDWAGGDLTGAHGEAYDAVRDGKVLHNPQPTLDIAAQTAVTKALGDGWVLDRSKSPSDVSPLLAFIGALWLLKNPVSEPPPPSPPPTALKSADVVGTPGDDFASIGF